MRTSIAVSLMWYWIEKHPNLVGPQYIAAMGIIVGVLFAIVLDLKELFE